jgi:glycosyltransferase involved in cell wall biosynthesis
MGSSAIFCTVVIPTIGRPTLVRAVESVLSQEFPQDAVEVVVVNDSGKSLPSVAWQQSPRVRLLCTQKSKQVIARNTGAAVAVGRYLLFLDDDDWLLPGALNYFWMLATKHHTAGCLFGSFALVDDSGSILARHCLPASGNVSIQLLSGYWMQVAAVMIRTDLFFAAGGLSPLFRISEEIDLFNRLAIAADFAGTDTLVAHIYRGRGWQTSVDYREVYESNRLARDRVLSMPHAYNRLRGAAGAGSYWHGRMVRIYLLSLLWNWGRKRRFCTGASRGVFALRSILSSRSYFLSKDFWQAVRRDLKRE